MVEPLAIACLVALNKVAAAVTPANAVAGIVGNRADKIFSTAWARTIDYFLTNVDGPENATLLGGIQKAHDLSVDHLLETIDTQARSAADRAIAEKIVVAIKASRAAGGKSAQSLTTEGLSMLASERSGRGGQSGINMVAADRFIDWIELATGEILPQHFRDLFTKTAPNKQRSWLAAFNFYLSKEIADNAAFSRIFLANNLSDLIDRAITLEDLVGNIHDDVSETQASVEELRSENRADFDKLFELVEKSGVISRAAEAGISEKAVREIVENLGGKAISKEELIPWLEDWIATAKIALEAHRDKDSEFSAARAEAERLFQTGQGASASAPFMELLEREAKETQKRQAELLNEAIRFDLLTLNILAASSKVRQLAALLGENDPDSKGRFFEEQAVFFHKIGATRGDRAALLMSLEIGQMALAEYRKLPHPAAWVRMQTNQASALLSLGERETGNARLIEAIQANHAALAVCTREVAPYEWGMAQGNLARALLRLGEREFGSAHLEEAIARLRSALEVLPRPIYSDDRAHIEMNLGIVLYQLGEKTDDIAMLGEAISTFNAALEVYTHDRMPSEWGRTQMNLALALLALGKRRKGPALIEQAVVACRAALEERTRERVPMEWAMTNMNLASGLVALSKVDGNSGHLDEAISCYRMALEEFLRDQSPVDWANCKINLARALVEQASREEGTALLNDAVGEITDALDEVSLELSPYNWANIQKTLGGVLFDLGQREQENVYFERSIIAYQNALREITQLRDPLGWARTQLDLGGALTKLGERETGTDRFEAAIVAIELALTELTLERTPRHWADAHNSLSIVNFRLGGNGAGTERLAASVECGRKALEVYTRDAAPLDWALTLERLGCAQAMLGERQNDVGLRREAIATFRLALEEVNVEAHREDWARIQGNFANLLFSLGSSENDLPLLQEASSANLAALEVHSQQRTPYEWAVSRSNQGFILSALARHDDEQDIHRVEEAIRYYREALTLLGREYIPLEWVRASAGLACALADLVNKTEITAPLAECRDILRTLRPTLETIQNNELRNLVQGVGEYVQELIRITNFPD